MSHRPGTLCSVLHPRKGLGHVAVAELKQLASVSVPWRGAMLNSNAWQLDSCDRSGSGVTVPYRHGLQCIDASGIVSLALVKKLSLSVRQLCQRSRHRYKVCLPARSLCLICCGRKLPATDTTDSNHLEESLAFSGFRESKNARAPASRLAVLLT